MSTISLKELFAAAKPKQYTADIEWQGNTATIYFQRLSYGEVSDATLPFVRKNGDGLDPKEVKNYQATIIARTLRDADGASIVSMEDVLEWDPVFFSLINKEVEKHNPVSAAAVENAAKNSATTTADSNS